MSTKYKVLITTSDKTSDAGTNSTVKIQLVGEDGSETKWHKLDKFLRNDFKPGKTDDFTVSCKDVGLPAIIRFKLSNWLWSDEWLCDIVVVEYDGKKAEFPIYEWISDSIEVGRGDAQLPQNITSEVVKQMRIDEVSNNRAKFAWVDKPTDPSQVGWGLPRYVNAANATELPRIFLRSEVRSKNFMTVGLSGAVNDIIQMVEALAHPIKTLKEYHDLYEHDKLKRENPLYLDDWHSDEGFGRQILNGITQPCFKRLESVDCLPRECFITSADVEPVLGDGKTLDSEAKAGKIYVIDYLEYFKKVPRMIHHSTGKPLDCPNCFAMFYVNDQEQFLPLAIQLVPDSGDHVFTPRDKEEDWMLAKMYFRCAQGNVHEWISHFLATHGAMEPFGVALFRSLPRAHPVYKLLYPHLRTVMVINTDARTSLITKTAIPAKGISTEALGLTREVYKNFNISQLNLPNQLKRLGIYDAPYPPNYCYREDGLKLWNAIEGYVTNVLRHYYLSDEDIVNDFELQGWAQDVAVEGLGWQEGDTKGMPEKITGVDELIGICVALIFTSSAQHAAVNFGQFENYKYVPNSPLGMRLPPHAKGQGSHDRILESLPDPVMAAAVITIVYALSDYSPNEIYLGNFPKKFFTEQKIIDMQEDFRGTLRKIEGEIQERNSGLEHPYTYLLPSRVPNSIAI